MVPTLEFHAWLFSRFLFELRFGQWTSINPLPMYIEFQLQHGIRNDLRNPVKVSIPELYTLFRMHTVTTASNEARSEYAQKFLAFVLQLTPKPSKLI